MPTFRHFDTFSDNSFLNIFSFAICHETTLADKGSPGILIKIFTRFSVAKTLNSFQTLFPLQTYTLHFLQRSYHMMSESIFSSCCFFYLCLIFLLSRACWDIMPHHLKNLDIDPPHMVFSAKFNSKACLFSSIFLFEHTVIWWSSYCHMMIIMMSNDDHHIVKTKWSSHHSKLWYGCCMEVLSDIFYWILIKAGEQAAEPIIGLEKQHRYQIWVLCESSVKPTLPLA